jgi:hypothetical protein
MESKLSDRKLKPLPPDPFRHQDPAIAHRRLKKLLAETMLDASTLKEMLGKNF